MSAAGTPAASSAATASRACAGSSMTPSTFRVGYVIIGRFAIR